MAFISQVRAPGCGGCRACGKRSAFPSVAWKTLRVSHSHHSLDDDGLGLIHHVRGHYFVLLWQNPASDPVSISLHPGEQPGWVAMHPQRIEAAIAGMDGSVRIFNEKGDLVNSFVLNEPLDWVGYGAKGEFLVARCTSTDQHPQHFYFFGAQGGAAALQLEERGLFEMGSPEFNADRTLLAVPEGNGVLILDAIRRTKGPLLKHGAPPATARFNRDGSLLLTTSLDRSAIVWNTKSWTAASPAMLHPAPVLGGEFLADDRWVLTSDYDAMVRLWDRLQPVVATVPWKLGDWANQLTVDRGWVGVAGVDGSARFFKIEPPHPRLSGIEPFGVWRTQPSRHDPRGNGNAGSGPKLRGTLGTSVGDARAEVLCR